MTTEILTYTCHDKIAPFDIFLSVFEAAGLAAIILKGNRIIKYNSVADALFNTLMHVPQEKGSFLYSLSLQPTDEKPLFQADKNGLQYRRCLCSFLSNDGSIHEREVVLCQIAWSKDLYTVAIVKEIRQDKEQFHTLNKDEIDRCRMAKRIEQLNSALKSLVENREIEKQVIETHVWSNFKTVIYPYFERMANCPHSKTCRANYRIIHQNIAQIEHPEGEPHLQFLYKLSPNEVKITDLIRIGKSTKEISQVLNLAPRSVCWYRNRIRKKLGLVNGKINLREFLVQSYTSHTRPN